jgi:hypothetical protein
MRPRDLELGAITASLAQEEGPLLTIPTTTRLRAPGDLGQRGTQRKPGALPWG